MLLRRYGNLDYIYSCPLDSAQELISFAVKADREERIYNQWLTGGYNQKYDFDKFRNIINAQSDKRTAEEILADVQKIMGEFSFVKGDGLNGIGSI